MKMKHKTNNRSGFSLGEVLLSVTVLLVGILVLITLMSKSVQSALYSRDVITATELAQEGVELVRNVRDNQFADGASDVFTHAIFIRNHCQIDPVNLNGASCDMNYGAEDQYVLGYSFPLGFRYATATKSKFSRYVNIDYNPGQKTAVVTSFVHWGTTIPKNATAPTLASCTLVNRCVYVQDVLKAWYKML
jgi:Tfp pilus assembly protein PilV